MERHHGPFKIKMLLTFTKPSSQHDNYSKHCPGQNLTCHDNTVLEIFPIGNRILSLAGMILLHSQAQTYRIKNRSNDARAVPLLYVTSSYMAFASCPHKLHLMKSADTNSIAHKEARHIMVIAPFFLDNSCG